MNDSTDVYLSLGSNLGSRTRNLHSAIEKLKDLPRTRVVSVSRLYKTQPRYSGDQPSYLNCAVALKTTINPRALGRRLRAIETALGRRASHGHLQSRPIDIDIVLYGGRIISRCDLVIPHASYRERRFVLKPLAEIAGSVICPDTGQSVAATLRRCRDCSSVRLYREAKP